MINAIVRDQFALLHESHALRVQILDALSDKDLVLRLGGDTLTLGALCKEMGEIEHVYTQSFKTFKLLDWSYRNPDTRLETSVDRLKAWFRTLDDDLEVALAALSDSDIQNKHIDRGGWSVPVTVNFHIYREALLIFAAKASLYLRAMRKPLSEQMRQWIG
jgi:hypothetical protein